METDLDAELDHERAHLAASRAALRRMRDHAVDLHAHADQMASDGYSAETLGVTLRSRIVELADNPDTPLFFGRLDFAADAGTPAGDGTPGNDAPGNGGTATPHDVRADTAGPGDPGDHPDAPASERHYIGRRHVTDPRGEPLVLDWRAPLSRAFYRASVRDPQGVTVRRRFGFSGGTLTSFEDEHLARGEEHGTGSRILTSEIERPRVGPMRDIVATIQPDQDELVRAALEESVCVQGAPGTGKTAVGLHRAAYLLYTHRERLRRSGVLIIGPNRAFLRYIAAVLPALGEFDVTQSTVDDLLDTRPTGTDPATAQQVKHDARMAEVLRRALAGCVAVPTEPIMVSDGSYRWRLPVEVLRRLVAEVRAEAPPYHLGRERLRARVVGLLRRQAEVRSGDSPGDAWARRMGRAAPVTAFLDACWPAITPQALVYRVLRDPSGPAEGILSGEEQNAIRWAKPPRSVRSARWSAADALLVDEAAGLMERLPSVGHVVVDEAQDLSPMQCRAIARRAGHASLTLLGDLAQGTAPWAARDWADTLRHLGVPGAAVVPLTTGFRVPEAVLALANRLLPALPVAVAPATSLRRDGWLRLVPVSGPAAVAEVLAGEVAQAVRLPGSIGVIAADDAVPDLLAAVRAAGLPAAGPTSDDRGTADQRVTVLPATLAKGLEYDHVIVVEPAAIVEAEPRGLNRLYVVLTRAVSRLAVIHARALPPPLS